MTARRLREWPRVTIAVVGLAVLLVAVGVLAASASSGTATRKAAPVIRTVTVSQTVTGVPTDAATISKLSAKLSVETAQLSSTRAALRTMHARARCWRARALHLKHQRAAGCTALR